LLAATAGLGALLAVLHVRSVLFTFVGAGFADFYALSQQMHPMLGAPGYQAGRKGANVGAVAVEADAGHHHFDILFLQARGSAPLTSSDAGVKRVEKVLMLIVHREGKKKLKLNATMSF
jgi:hypothetical protein